MTSLPGRGAPVTRAMELHREAIVIDAVCPLMHDPSHWGDWVAGGATVAAPTVAARTTYPLALETLVEWQRRFVTFSDQILPILEPEDVHSAKQRGLLGILLHFQDSLPVGADLRNLETFAALGARMIGLAYNARNLVGDGCGEPSDTGLSRFGRSFVGAMNDLGLIVDCSHTGYRTTMEAITLSKRPPVFSHSNPRALCDNGRNIRDDQIRAVSDHDGLVGIGGFPAFLRKTGRPTLDDWLDHLEYVVDLVGVDHVGIGLDFFAGVDQAGYEGLVRAGEWYPEDYPPPPHPYPERLDNPRLLPNITSGLLGRGYSEPDVLQVLGGNWLRVLSANRSG